MRIQMPIKHKINQVIGLKKNKAKKMCNHKNKANNKKTAPEMKQMNQLTKIIRKVKKMK